MKATAFTSRWLDWEPGKKGSHPTEKGTDTTDKSPPIGASVSIVSPEQAYIRGIFLPDTPVRIFTRLLDASVWIVVDAEMAEELEEELRAEGRSDPILTVAEATILGGMAAADARDLFAVLVRVQAAMPGSRLRSVGPMSGDA